MWGEAECAVRARVFVRDDVVLPDPRGVSRERVRERRWTREEKPRCEADDDVRVRTKICSRKSERGRPKRAGDEGVDVVERC